MSSEAEEEEEADSLDTHTERLEDGSLQFDCEFYLVAIGLRHRLPGFSSLGRLVILR